MPFSHKQLMGPGYAILNVMRAFNIITLLAVTAACIVMLVKTFIVSKFFFFDAVSNVITASISLFLIVSETGFFSRYFNKNWPLLAPASGFVSLGCAMMVIGVNMLGNLNREATTQESLGMPFWRLVIASGILVFVFGFFNIVASYVFRDKKQGITARNVRAQGFLAEPTPPLINKSFHQLSINTDYANANSVLPTHTISRGNSNASRGLSRGNSNASSHSSHYPKNSGAVSPSVYTSRYPSYIASDAPPMPTHNRNYNNSDNEHLAVPQQPPRTPLTPFTNMLSSARSAVGKVRDSVIPSYYHMSNKARREKRGSVGPQLPIAISGPMNVDRRFEGLGVIQKPEMVHPAMREKEGVAF